MQRKPLGQGLLLKGTAPGQRVGEPICSEQSLALLPTLVCRGGFCHHQRLPAATADAAPRLAYSASNLPNDVAGHRRGLHPAAFVDLPPPWEMCSGQTENWLRNSSAADQDQQFHHGVNTLPWAPTSTDQQQEEGMAAVEYWWGWGGVISANRKF